MVRSAEEVLLPARFLTLMGHWVACLTLLLDRAAVSERSLPADGDFGRNKRSLVACAVLAVIFGAVELALLFVGFTMFMRTWSTFQVLVHLLGLVLTAVLIEARWSLGAWIAIMVFCSLLPCASESLIAFLTVRCSFRRW